jgi:exopolysaccharide production protein ExoQ
MSTPISGSRETRWAGVAAYRAGLAVVGIFTLIAGDFWRYLLSWWGYGAIAVVLVTLAVIELIRSREDLRRLPLSLVAALILMVLSIAWSAYPGASAVGVATTLATTAFAVFLATALTWTELVDALARALRVILVLSLVFEFVVAAVVREPVLPMWVDYSALEQIPRAFYWSRDLLFEGGRIQGIVGNANILAMAALLSLIAEVARRIARRGSPVVFVLMVAVGIATLALTRSSTVLVAAAAVAVVSLVAWLARRGSGGRRVAAAGGLLALVAASVAAALAWRGPLLELLGKSPDLTNRLDIWATVAGLAGERPVAGWGWISYWAPWVEPFDDLVVIRGVTYLQAHNAWLDVFLQLGIVGLVVVGLFVVTTLVRSWVYALDGLRSDALVPLALLVAVLVQSLAESRLLIEIGWALLVIVSIRTAAHRWERR